MGLSELSWPRFRKTGQLCGVAAAGLGAAALLGWASGLRALTSLSLGARQVPMVPDAAGVMIVLGITLVVLARRPDPSSALRPPSPLRRRAGWLVPATALLVVLYASLHLVELLMGKDLGTDRWLYQPLRRIGALDQKEQMSFFTALNFWFTGSALFLLVAPVSQYVAGRVVRFLAVMVLSISLVFSLGFLYGGEPFFYDQPAIRMAFTSALSFLLLGVGLIALMGPEHSPLGHLLGPSVAARLLRAFLPFTVILVGVVAVLTYLLGRWMDAAPAALICALLAVAAMFLASFLCERIAHVVSGNLEAVERKLRDAEQQSRNYATRLVALNTSLEQRVIERTAALRASRDRLDQFFTILTSLHNPDNADKTFDLVLSFCQQMGYDQAMLSLIDPEARVVRAVKAVGRLTEIVNQTVRPLGGDDILAVVAREGKTVAIPDATQDPRCDQPAAAAAGVRGLIVLPLVSGGVVGVLQVASEKVLNPAAEELRALETLGGEAARALAGLDQLARIRQLNRQLEQRNQQLQDLATDLKKIAVSEHQARDALRKSEARLRLLLESSGEGVYGIDREGHCTFINRAAAEMLGLMPEDVLGQDMHALIHRRQDGEPYPAAECPILRVVYTGRGCRVDQEFFWRKDWGGFPVEYSAYPIREGRAIRGAVVTFTDITQRKQAEEALHFQNTLLQQSARSEREAHEALKQAQSQLVQSEKLAALGQMVAGVAHEINNPLAFVGNNLAVLQRDAGCLRDLLRMYQAADDLLAQHQPQLRADIQALAERIDLGYTLNNLDGLMMRSRDGVRRIQQIVKDLRDFARLDESDLHEVDVNAGIDSTMNIIRPRAKKQEVELVVEPATLPVITCYPAKINQVVLNLVANAIDACPAGGRVTVKTEAEADGVAIHVCDTGCGIDPSIRDKVFDPFFTTKPPGQGTGLGLSISYQIIQDHGGSLDFESAPGQGTHFIVRLPLHPPQRQGSGGRGQEAGVRRQGSGGRGQEGG